MVWLPSFEAADSWARRYIAAVQAEEVDVREAEVSAAL